MIVKVQIPLSGPEDFCLVYDQARKHQVQQTITPATDRLLGRDVKGYFEATWNARMDVWDIGKRVGAQPW